METGVKTSFIPHDVTQSARARMSEGSLLDLAILMSIVLLIASVVLAGGVFIYKKFLENSNKLKIESLQAAREEFSPDFARQATRLNDRMLEAEKILNKHLAPSVFFRLLESDTLTTVSFQSLELTEGGDGNGISVKMTGIAESVNSVALQARIFSNSGLFISPMFSDINRQVDGVHFNFTATLNISDMRYAKAETDAAGGLVPAQSAPPYAPPPTPSLLQPVPAAGGGL